MAVGKRNHGYTMVALLILLAVLMLGLSVAGPMWSAQNKRERERELLKIGLMYARAIARYQQESPGSSKPYPVDLSELLADNRYVGTKRYMRKLYPDPVSHKSAWGLIKDKNNRIVGVHSLSVEEPISQGVIVLSDAKFGDLVLKPAKQYSDWKFTFVMVAPS